jgi:MFS family permease
MDKIAADAPSARSGSTLKDSLIRRKYVIPFLLACIILFCNTATGINSIIGYNTSILLQSGLSDLHAHWGYVVFTFVNFFMTIVGMTLVDRKGRKFLLTVGTSGIIVSLVGLGLMFLTTKTEPGSPGAVQSMVARPDALLPFNPAEARQLIAAPATGPDQSDRASLAVIYSMGTPRCYQLCSLR